MMTADFLKTARSDKPVYLGDVREAFARTGTRPFPLAVTLYDGSVRRFSLRLPETRNEEERAFVQSYVYASVYNILCALGAREIALAPDPADREAAELAASLDGAFQTGAAKKDRRGYGKCLNVNERTIAALTGGKARFCFRVVKPEELPAETPEKPAAGEPVFAALPDRTKGRLLLGMDIGGTDIKLAASVDGTLAVYKEFDWFPAAFETAEELIGPMLALTRMMRAAACLVCAGKADALDREALGKHATAEQMRAGTERMERAAGQALRGFDGIGLCFPDVVIRNRIVGGETYKTRGMRENAALDYEEQFRRITVLDDRLREYVVPGGAVMNTNDGPMAAFTAAVEQAAAGEDVSKGFFAHTLGTELGTGWVRPDGSIPEIPLEVYNFIIDLGSFGQRQFEPDDVRSVDNFNTGLPGTLQKYTCQSGVFRLAAERLPREDPAAWREALDRGLLVWRGKKLVVPTEPKDMRKPCLEFFMAKAADPAHPACAEIFRQIGEYLAATWRETQYVLRPETPDRTLFGRLVKNPECFRLLCEGAARRAPELRQFAADDSLANTPLMRQLAGSRDYTVAQFAQAVGAIHYACLALA
jgi:hypothetical protein